MKKATLFAVLLLSCLAFAQQEAPIAKRNRYVGITSGTTQKILNPTGVLLPTFGYTFVGAPSGVSIVAKGCMTGDTDTQNCVTLETDTTTTTSQIRTFPTNTTAYDYFLITPTFTGGTSPTLTINSTLPPFAKAGGGGGGGTWGSITGTLSSQTDLQTALNLLAPIASPTFTGTPAAPTAAADTNTTQLATTAYVVGQGYAKLASPTFTGTVTLPNSQALVTPVLGTPTSGTLTNTTGYPWSALANPGGNLALSNGTNTTIFSGTAATNQFFAWKNTTAAVVGTSQGSPILGLCGRAFHGSADVEDCLTLKELPGNGNDAAITFTIGHTGTSTGLVTTAVPGPISVSDGTTSLPSLTFTGQTTTGFFRQASGQVVLSLNNSNSYLFGAGFFRLRSDHLISWNSTTDAGAGSPDTSLARAAAGIIEVATTAANRSGLIIAGNSVRVASDFTTAANTSLQTITGLSWTVPATALNFNFHCHGAYSQATGAAAVAFGIQAATNAPTNIFATGIEQITVGPPATLVTGTLATLTTTTATSVVSGTPGAQATNYTWELFGTIENPASANTFNVMVSTATSGDAVTVLRGSYCSIAP